MRRCGETRNARGRRWADSGGEVRVQCVEPHNPPWVRTQLATTPSPASAGWEPETFLHEMRVERERNLRASQTRDSKADTVHQTEFASLRCQQSGHCDGVSGLIHPHDLHHREKFFAERTASSPKRLWAKARLSTYSLGAPLRVRRSAEST